MRVDERENEERVPGFADSVTCAAIALPFFSRRRRRSSCRL